MVVLDRLRAWWRRLRSSSDAGPGVAGAAGVAADYECAVCGTGVDDPAGPCPLCRGSEVVPAGEPADDTPTDDGEAAGSDAGTGGPTADRRRVAGDDEESVQRLRTLRADGELLERHADRWRPVDAGFLVETGDGTRVVDSREEVVALLRAEDS